MNARMINFFTFLFFLSRYTCPSAYLHVNPRKKNIISSLQLTFLFFIVKNFTAMATPVSPFSLMLFLNMSLIFWMWWELLAALRTFIIVPTTIGLLMSCYTILNIATIAAANAFIHVHIWFIYQSMFVHVPDKVIPKFCAKKFTAVLNRTYVFGWMIFFHVFFEWCFCFTSRRAVWAYKCPLIFSHRSNVLALTAFQITFNRLG